METIETPKKKGWPKGKPRGKRKAAKVNKKCCNPLRGEQNEQQMVYTDVDLVLAGAKGMLITALQLLERLQPTR